MNYREPLTKNEIREHAAHYENSNPAVYCGTYAKYNNGSLYGNSCSKITSTTPSSGTVKAAWAKPLSIKSKSMPHWASFSARLTRHTSRIGMMARSMISMSATRAATKAPKILRSTFARNAAISRTSPRGCNAALIIRQYGAILIRVAITPRSMGTSSGIEQGQRKLLFDSLFVTILFKMCDKIRIF